MPTIHPLDLLQGYHLGNRQATVELQRTDILGIHIEFGRIEVGQNVGASNSNFGRLRLGESLLIWI
jgi:hypothetical protein